MNYSKVQELFTSLENDKDFFSVRVKNIPIWEVMRYQVYVKIMNIIGLYEPSYTIKKESFRNRFTRLIKATFKALKHNPFYSKQKDIFFLGLARRKLEEDGLWWDIFCDPIIDNLKLQHIYVEDWYLGIHKTPAKTKPIYYMDIIRVTASLIKIFYRPFFKLNKLEISQIKEMEEAIYEKFSFKLNLLDTVKEILLDRYATLPFFKLLLKKIKPKLVFLIASYGNEVFIEACKYLKIKTVELQHGSITKYNYGYSFEKENAKKRLFPDYIFLFGDYWKDSVKYAIESSRVIPVGYPYFEFQKSKIPNTNRRNKITIISQKRLGARFSKIAIEVADKYSDKYEVCLKLHPREYSTWIDDYPWLHDKKVTVVDSDNPPLYKLLSESIAQIGVYSTALFEGLSLGCQTFLVDLPGVEQLQYLIDIEIVTKINDVDDICISNRPSSFSDDYFFKKNALQNIDLEIKELLSTK